MTVFNINRSIVQFENVEKAWLPPLLRIFVFAQIPAVKIDTLANDADLTRHTHGGIII